MPLTPFHLGPGLFFGTIFLKYLDLIAFLVGSVILDIEPFFVVLFNLNKPYLSYPHHGFFHTILGAVLISFIAALILDKFKGRIKQVLKRIGIIQVSSFKKIFLSVLSGILLHLFFDSLMHYDVFPFWPSHYNPFLRKISFSQNYFLVITLGVLGVILLFWKINKSRTKFS